MANNLKKSLKSSKVISKGVVPVDLSKVEKEKKFISYLPLDREKYLQYQEAFHRRITPSFIRDEIQDEEGKKLIIYTTKTKGGELSYRFYEEIIKKEVGEETSKKTPTLVLGMPLWLSMIYFAKKQGNGLQGYFTFTKLMRLWEIDPNTGWGKFKDDIRRNFIAIVAGGVSFTNQKRGEERIDWGFNFVSSYIIKREGRETCYYYRLTPEALGITEKWLKGELTVDEIKKRGGYIAYPLFYLRERLPERERRLRDRLLTHKGGVPVKVHTICKDWIKLPPDWLRKPRRCRRLLRKYLNNAKERGEILDFKFEGRGLKDWRNKWKVIIYKPTAQKRDKKILTSDERERVDTIVKWLSRPIWDTKTPRDKLRLMVEKLFETYGAEKVWEIYNKTANGPYPSTKKFWEEIKKLKAGKKSQKQEQEAREGFISIGEVLKDHKIAKQINSFNNRAKNT